MRKIVHLVKLLRIRIEKTNNKFDNDNNILNMLKYYFTCICTCPP